MRKTKRFNVYIMANDPRSATLYTGVTGDLVHRVWQHKNKLVPGFTSRYNLTRLVYYECFFYPDAAIAREKEIKGWRRSKKIKLIEAMNPRWDDLAERWQDGYKPAVLRERSLGPLVKARAVGMTPSPRAPENNEGKSDKRACSRWKRHLVGVISQTGVIPSGAAFQAERGISRHNDQCALGKSNSPPLRRASLAQGSLCPQNARQGWGNRKKGGVRRKAGPAPRQG